MRPTIFHVLYRQHIANKWQRLEAEMAMLGLVGLIDVHEDSSDLETRHKNGLDIQPWCDHPLKNETSNKSSPIRTYRDAR